MYGHSYSATLIFFKQERDFSDTINLFEEARVGTGPCEVLNTLEILLKLEA